jgi:apolipoprotein N-acyltransferase
MSMMRAVEDGFTLVRDAKVGLMTAADDRGRILAEESNVDAKGSTTMLVTVPVRHDGTLYQRWGDWFAWVDLAALAALLIVAIRSRRQRAPVGEVAIGSEMRASAAR